MNYREIGGFFQLELNRNYEYHKDAIKLNSARYCLQYILKTKKYKKIFIPYYICDSILKPILEEKVNYEYYYINEKFEPVIEKQLLNEECLLYVNYFGINTKNVNKVIDRFKNVIIDNTQAFFEIPLDGVDTIYSCRKFFGVPDGGYLYTNMVLEENIEEEISYDRCEHLLKRVEISASEGYKSFRKNEEYLNICGMKKMSTLTSAILSSVDYEKCKSIRNENFMYLHENLKSINELKFDISNLNGAMVYPLLINDDNLRKNLIKNNIYVATYWNDVSNRTTGKNYEFLLSKYLIPLNIDQRYNTDDMMLINKVVNDNIRN